jgi:DNA primase
VPVAATRASFLAAAPEGAEDRLREGVVLAVLALHPALLPRFEADLERLDPGAPDLAALHAALLSAPPADDAAELRAALPPGATEALDRLLARADLRVVPVIRAPGDAERAALCLSEEFARLEARRAARRETAHAMEDLAGFADEGVTWRLGQAAAALDRAGRAELPPLAAESEDPAALTARLDALLAPEGLRKK